MGSLAVREHMQHTTLVAACSSHAKTTRSHPDFQIWQKNLGSRSRITHGKLGWQNYQRQEDSTCSPCHCLWIRRGKICVWPPRGPSRLPFLPLSIWRKGLKIRLERVSACCEIESKLQHLLTRKAYGHRACWHTAAPIGAQCTNDCIAWWCTNMAN